MAGRAKKEKGMPELADVAPRLKIIKAVFCPSWKSLLGLAECKECTYYRGQVREADKQQTKVVCAFGKK